MFKKFLLAAATMFAFSASSAHAQVILVQNPVTLQQGVLLGTVNNQAECQVAAGAQGYLYAGVQLQLVWTGFGYAYVNYCYGFVQNPNGGTVNNPTNIYTVRVKTNVTQCKTDLEWYVADVQCRFVTNSFTDLECKIPQQRIQEVKQQACVAGVYSRQ